MPVTSAQLRMARAALNWTVRDLAEATGLHRNTITNIEINRYAGDQKSLERIEAVLRKAGVDFIDENGGGPGVRLRKPARVKPPKWVSRVMHDTLPSHSGESRDLRRRTLFHNWLDWVQESLRSQPRLPLGVTAGDWADGPQSTE